MNRVTTGLVVVLALATASILVAEASLNHQEPLARPTGARFLPVEAPSGTGQPAREPAPSLGLGPGDRVHILSYAEWSYVESFVPADEEYVGARVLWCESHFDDSMVGTAGELGRWQILPAWLDDRDVRAGLARVGVTSWKSPATVLTDPVLSGIVAREIDRKRPGFRYWSTADGCGSWNR